MTLSETRPSRRARLADARLYLCTDSRADRGGLEPFLDEVLPAGVDVVQLRQKGLEAAQELELLAVMAAACRRHGALLGVNDRADIAAASRADVLHLGQRDLTPQQARRVVGPEVLIGRSTHDRAQAVAADADPQVDYFCTGPIWATPTKPGRPATGLGLPGAVAADDPSTPWFAIGGIDAERLADVVRAGARRVVVVRAVGDAADPAGAVRLLRERLTR